MPRPDPISNLGLSLEDAANLRAWTRAWSTHLPPVAFVGAGLSVFHGMPHRDRPPDLSMKTWAGLATDFVDAMATGATGRDEHGPLPGDPLRLAELVATQTSRASLLEIVRRAVPDEYYDPGQAHRALARIPWAAIVTTNYDSLIERGFDGRRTPPHVVVDDSDLLQRRRSEGVLLIKMHGDLRRPDSIVISEDDYRRYGADGFARAAVALKVQQLLVEHPLIFLGFGLSDPNVERLLGWVRDTVGRLQTHAIAVVHGSPRYAERLLWERRGIKLVVSGGDLRGLLDAVDDERLRPSPAASATSALITLRETTERLKATIRSRRSDQSAISCVMDVVGQVERALGSAIDDDAHECIRDIARGMGDEADWRPLLGALTPEQTIRLALILSRTPFFFQVTRERFVDIRVGLLAFGLASGSITDSERLRIATSWIDSRIDEVVASDIDGYVRVLSAWRSTLSTEVHPQVDRLILDLSRVRMDAANLQRLASQSWSTSLELCRAGAASLSLGDRASASRSYRDARDRARTAVEMRASLIGIVVADGDSMARRELAREQTDIGDAVFDFDRLREQAAGQALQGDKQFAAGRLAEYVRAARRIGLPDDWGPIADAVRHSSTFVLEDERTEPTDILRALDLRIQYGLARDTRRDVPDEAIERAARDPKMRQRVRDLLLRKGLPARSTRAQVTHAVIAFDLLTDDEMDAIVRDLIRATSESAHQAREFHEAWAALTRGAQRLPARSARRIAAFCASRKLRHSDHEYFDAFDTSLVPTQELRSAAEVTRLATWVTRNMRDDAFASDWFFRMSVANAAFELARLVASPVRQEWCKLIERAAALAIADRDDTGSNAVDIMRGLVALEHVPADAGAFAEYLIQQADEVARSSLLPQWAAAVELVARRSGRSDDLRRAVVRAANGALPHARPNDPFGRVFADTTIVRTLTALVEFEGKKLTRAEMDVLERYREVNPATLGLFGHARLGISKARRDRAERELADAALISANGEAAVRGLIEWCLHQRPSQLIGDLLIGLLAAGRLPGRRLVARGAGELLRAGKCSRELLKRLAIRMVSATAPSRPWYERAQAVLAVGALEPVLGADARRTIESLIDDEVAIVRRAARKAAAGET